MYGRTVDKFYKTFRIKQLEEYGNLFIKLPDMPQNGIIELLNQKEQWVQTAFIDGNEYIFQDIKPGRYYIRLIIDENVMVSGIQEFTRITSKQNLYITIETNKDTSKLGYRRRMAINNILGKNKDLKS